ncbi:hypothetical protein [Streptomyces wuyuanensis]|uniref:hypothetical protein n=1 Tax=Streptomyces wuyuanensis TaxID=1196353 RepID=UPI0038105E9C
MSSDSFYYGDNVNMNNSIGSTGMVKHVAAPNASPALSAELQEAVQELLRLVADLREQLPPASTQVLDASLPNATGDAAIPAQTRRSALTSIAGIAAVAGPLGQPIIDTVTQILELLGG